MPRKVIPVIKAGKEIPPLFPPGDHRKTINIDEVAELTGIKKPTLRHWVRKNRIPGAFQSVKNSHWFFRREPLEKWWQELLSRNSQ